ncbi:MAG: hypothetical protein K6B65_06155 [Bacilli bacterium]|nr:hypothetical protein [Bacilli bacterium]
MLLDFALLVILNVILLFGIDSIVSVSGGQKGVAAEIANNESSLKAIIKESHLDEFDANGNAKGPEDNAKTYILRLTYGSLIEGGASEGDISEKLYAGVDPISSQNELCYHYYCSFKAEKNQGFLDGYASNYGQDHYRSILTKGFEDDYAKEGFPYLTLESAKKVDESYRNAKYSEGLTLRNALQSHYQAILEDAIKELKQGYSPYIEARKAYEESYMALWMIKIAEGFGAYALSSLILFFLLPIILKNGSTASSKILKTPYRRNDGYEPNILNNLLRFLLLGVEYLLAPVLSLLFIYGANAKELLSVNLFGFAPVFTLMIYSFVLMLLSYLFTFLPNKKRQTLSEFCSGLIQVDGREMERGD